MGSFSNRRLGLVIPTFNEAGNVVPLLDRLRAISAQMPVECGLIVVDDNSTDGTADLVRIYAERDPRVRVLVRKGKRGLAGAVLHGWAQTDATVLGVIDGDLQHPPELLPALLESVLNGSDIAIASRYSTASGYTDINWNRFRGLISRCGTVVTMPLQRRDLRVKDPLSGYFVLRRECIQGLHLQSEGFKILLEILVKGNIHNAVEIPFCFANRQWGRSKADFKVALHYLGLLGKLSCHSLFGAGRQGKRVP